MLLMKVSRWKNFCLSYFIFMYVGTPNRSSISGYNILKGDLLRFSEKNFLKTDPGFTSSPIFGYTRMDHTNAFCDFKGYYPNTLKTCQGPTILFMIWLEKLVSVEGGLHRIVVYDCRKYY